MKTFGGSESTAREEKRGVRWGGMAPDGDGACAHVGPAPIMTVRGRSGSAQISLVSAALS